MVYSTNNATTIEKTEVLYGTENINKAILRFVSIAKKGWNACADSAAPSVTIEHSKKLLLDAKNSGAKVKFLTDITKDNLPYCKELMDIVDELRHLDGVKGNFGVSESEYLASATLQEAKPITEIIYSNVRAIVEQHHYLFKTLWNAAISAKQRIKEIEEGIIRYETKVIKNPEEIIKQIRRLTQNSNELSTCLPGAGLEYSYNYFFDIKKKLLDKQKRGEHKGIRYVTNIDNDSLQRAKAYLEYGIQIRHVRNLPPMSFGVSDKEIAVTIEEMAGGRRIQTLLISNEPLYLKHYSTIFEELWRNGIDAADRIRDIEEGVDLADIKIIQNPKEGITTAWNIIKSAREEVSIMFSSANALRRQIQVGGLQLLKEASEEHGAKVRLSIPADIENDDVLSEIKEQVKLTCPKVDVRIIEKSLRTRITIVLADRKDCIIIELKDDTKDISYTASGLSTYSNSKSIVTSYASIFESLWRQTELYEQLKVHDRIQKEFINVAAHELRTPVQPILGLSEILQSKIKDNEQRGLIDIISRNAKRLQRLTEDILDITRIESQTLRLHKEKVNLNEKIINVINDIKGQIPNPDNLQMVFSEPKEPIYVEADKTRLYQVIANLLNNAIKFTKEGMICINADVKDNSEVIITIRDTGAGIDPEILPNLFTKFATKSATGTGLGLFISKGIIEGHGGRIWAENNPDRKGAIFSFSLPLLENQ